MRKQNVVVLTIAVLCLVALYLVAQFPPNRRTNLAELNAESAALGVQGHYSFVSEGGTYLVNEGKDRARFVIVLREGDKAKIGFRAYKVSKFLPGQPVYIKYSWGDYYAHPLKEPI